MALHTFMAPLRRLDCLFLGEWTSFDALYVHARDQAFRLSSVGVSHALIARSDRSAACVGRLQNVCVWPYGMIIRIRSSPYDLNFHTVHTVLHTAHTEALEADQCRGGDKAAKRCEAAHTQRQNDAQALSHVMVL